MQSQVTIYASVFTSLELLPTEAQQLRFLKAILAYAFSGTEPDLSDDPILNFGFAQVRPNLDSSRRKANAARENGAKGGRPKKETQEKPSQKPSENPGFPNDETHKPNDIYEKEKERDGSFSKEKKNHSLGAEPCAAVADKTAPQALRCPKCGGDVVESSGIHTCTRCGKSTSNPLMDGAICPTCPPEIAERIRAMR